MSDGDGDPVTEAPGPGGPTEAEAGVEAEPARRRPTNEELRGPRPAPAVPSLAGAAAGVFVVFGLFLLLGELGPDARLAGIGISLVFEVLGVALMQFSKGRRSATAGGTIAAVAVIPLLGFLFVDTPGDTIDSTKDVTGPVTAVLVVAALVWFCAWYFGPGRRYAFFLGAACLALWLAAQVQVVSNPLDQLVGGYSSAATFTPIGPSIGDDSYDDDLYSADDYYDDYGIDGSGDDGVYDLEDLGTDPDSLSYEEPFGPDDVPDVDDPTTKLGVVSLVFGCAYLALGGRRDRVGDTRGGTPLYAVAAPILFYAVGYLSGELDTVGTSALALALGGTALWLGTRAGRRFTAWAGTAACVFAVLSLVEEALGDSGRASAALLISIGLAIAVGAALLERRGDDHASEGDPAGGGDPAGEGDPAGGDDTGALPPPAEPGPALS